MKIYTGRGDKGETGLFSGERLSKNSVRVWAYGTVDELNSSIGLLKSIVKKEDPRLSRELENIQVRLFRIGSLLAVSPGTEESLQLRKPSREDIVELEEAIDRMTSEMPELRNFIIPGKNFTSATAHLARTICRRAERTVVKIYEEEKIKDSDEVFITILGYLNRLSDYLFTTARHCSFRKEDADTLWNESMQTD